jgi:CRP-like cAMP-binding protein
MLELRNSYFAALSTATQRRWKPHLSLKEFQVGDRLPLNQPDGAIYFPITCVAVASIYSNGKPSNFLRFVGRRSIIGVSNVLNVSKTEFEAVICCSGHAFVMPGLVLNEAIRNLNPSSELKIASMAGVLEQVLASAHCVQRHDSSQRVARVLLEALDHLVQGSEITLTHLQIAKLIGVRRETVTTLLTSWSRMGVVSTGHGSIKIEQRERLLEVACDCYHFYLESREAELEFWKTIRW